MNNTTIIAEAGVNHNGSMENALRLIDVAKDAGADYVKFQTFKANKLVSSKARKAEYQIENTNNADESQLEMLQKLELSPAQHQQIVGHCNQVGIKFFSTAFDLDSLRYLSKIGLNFVKIPSGEITNLPYLRLASQLFGEVILSTGMASLEDIRSALAVFTNAGISKEKITILHCNTEYPTPMQDVNLKAMLHIQREFGIAVGYSDHTLGIEVPVAAVALGATIIEKHFTLSKLMDGPDHAASLEPDELRAMILAIRNIELAVSGSGVKGLSPSEEKNVVITRKSIVAQKAIRCGELLTVDNLTVKRPGDGISPMKWDEVIGSIAVRDFDEDDLIELE